MGQFSPTTVNYTTDSTNKKTISLSKRKQITDYPLCSNLINEHLINGHFYRDIGAYSLNTEWLV